MSAKFRHSLSWSGTWLVRVESPSHSVSELSAALGEPDVVVTHEPAALLVYEPPRGESELAGEVPLILELLGTFEAAIAEKRLSGIQVCLHLHITSFGSCGLMEFPPELVASVARLNGSIEMFHSE